MDERWVSQSEAARLETEAGRPLAQSSVSRFLARNPDVPVRRNDRGAVQTVEYGALVRARGSSLSVQDSQAVREVAPQPAPTAPLVAAVPDANSRKRAADAERSEIELAQLKGTLISRDAVARAIEGAGVAFVQAMERRRRILAQRLAGIEDVRQVELLIKAADRELLNSLSTDLVKAGAGQGDTGMEDAA